jgi:hypothetical protein
MSLMSNLRYIISPARLIDTIISQNRQIANLQCELDAANAQARNRSSGPTFFEVRQPFQIDPNVYQRAMDEIIAELKPSLNIFALEILHQVRDTDQAPQVHSHIAREHESGFYVIQANLASTAVSVNCFAG